MILAVQTFPGANSRIPYHYPFFEDSGADVLGITTTDGKCEWPGQSVMIGENRYIDGQHLPKRLVETMRLLLLLPHDLYMISEWDCLFFQKATWFTGMAGFHAGNKIEGARANRFYHWPLGFDYETGQKFVKKADELMPLVSGHECSPDLFFGWVCEDAGIEVTQPWIGFSRNTIESPEDIELARQARINGAMAIHGVKSERVLKGILE